VHGLLQSNGCFLPDFVRKLPATAELGSEPTILGLPVGCLRDEIAFVAGIGLTLPAQDREGCSRWRSLLRADAFAARSGSNSIGCQLPRALVGAETANTCRQAMRLLMRSSKPKVSDSQIRSMNTSARQIAETWCAAVSVPNAVRHCSASC
jgi:hypothetical protein